MNQIAENLNKINQNLAAKADLIVVSKYRTIEQITEVYQFGQRKFAENRVQALLDRAEVLPKDIEWHLIGHLQTNKVKYIAPFIYMIQSVDSIKLLYEIEKEATKCNRIIDVLLQVFIAKEETKFGMEESELYALLNSKIINDMTHIRICGLMAMATNTDDLNQIHTEFSNIENVFNDVKKNYFLNKEYFKYLSIGMSSDYKIALEHGGNLVRIGSSVFE